MPVTQTATTALEQYYLLAVLLDLGYPLARLAVIDYRPAGHLDDPILAVLAERAALATLAAIGGLDVFLVLQVQQCPQVPVAAQDDMPATTAVTAVRTALGHILRAVEMQTACTALTRAAVDLDVVYKVRCHNRSCIRHNGGS